MGEKGKKNIIEILVAGDFEEIIRSISHETSYIRYGDLGFF